MLHKPQPEPLINISTRVFPETHQSLRRLQGGMGKSLPVVLRTIIQAYEKRLKRRLTPGELDAYETGMLDPARFTEAWNRRARPASNGASHSVGNGHDDWAAK